MSKIFLLTIISAFISLIFTPLVKRLALFFKIIDEPKNNNRKIHKKPVPLMGGLAIYISFVLVTILKPGVMDNAEMGIIIGATIIVVGGIIDDIKELKPWQKLMFQVGGALSLIINGVVIENITNPFGGADSFFNIGYFTIPFTIIWVVGITNAINLIDGLDGLAAGVALISSISILFIALIADRGSAAISIAILSGAIIGFLPYNFNPASIFMGDTGAQLLGFLLSAISIEGAIKSAAAFAIVVPIIAIGLPIYDTLFAMIRRKINGRPIMQADRGHLHHRLLDLGLSQKQAVLIMYLISACLGAISILAMGISTPRSYFLLTLVIIFIVFIAWKCGFFKHNE